MDNFAIVFDEGVLDIYAVVGKVGLKAVGDVFPGSALDAEPYLSQLGRAVAAIERIPVVEVTAVGQRTTV